MKDIDFLPARYRENDARRKAGVWRFALVLVLGGAVAAASLGQFAYRAKVQSQLVEIQPLLAQAHASEAHAAQLKSELHKVSQTATLYALVQTPWPRTQLVAAIVEPLDDTIVIHEIRCSRQLEQTPDRRNKGPEFDLGDGETKTPIKSATETDLTDIKQRLSESRDVVRIVGETGSQRDLHAYLERLESAASLFEAVELIEVDSIDTDNDNPRLRFSANVILTLPLGLRHSASSRPATERGQKRRLAG